MNMMRFVACEQQVAQFLQSFTPQCLLAYHDCTKPDFTSRVVRLVHKTSQSVTGSELMRRKPNEPVAEAQEA
jgi:hypothetical protein